MMADKNVGALLVTDKGKLIGIISERDYTRKVALKGSPPSKPLFAKSFQLKWFMSTRPIPSRSACA